MPPGATTVTFPLSALHVTADTPVAVSGSLQDTTRSGTVTVLKGLDTVTITKSQYTVSKALLNIEATSTNSTATLRVFNTTTDALVGTMSNAGGGKFVGQFRVLGPFTSATVQSSQGGLATVPVPQK